MNKTDPRMGWHFEYADLRCSKVRFSDIVQGAAGALRRNVVELCSKIYVNLNFWGKRNESYGETTGRNSS